MVISNPSTGEAQIGRSLGFSDQPALPAGQAPGLEKGLVSKNLWKARDDLVGKSSFFISRGT